MEYRNSFSDFHPWTVGVAKLISMVVALDTGE